MEKAKIEELLKKYNLDEKFTWSAGTVISDLVREYLPKFKIPFNPRQPLSDTITPSEFMKKVDKLNNVVGFFDDINSLEKQSQVLRDAISLQVFKYWSIGRILNVELGKDIVPRMCVVLPKIRQ